MPHVNEIEEAEEDLEDAVEGADDADTEPPPGAHKKRDKVRSTISLLTHFVALLAASGAFLKTCDHSVTKNAYEALSQNIQKLADQQKQNHDDLVAIHGYLDGMARAPMTAPAESAMTMALPPPAGGPPSTKGHQITIDRDSVTFVDGPPVPDVHPAPAPMKVAPFSAIESK